MKLIHKFGNMIRSRILFSILWLIFIGSTTILSFYQPKGDELVWFAAIREPILNQFFHYSTMLGEEYGFILMVVILAFFKSYRWAAAFAFTGISTMLISFVAKIAFHQPRPYLYFNSLDRAEELGSIQDYDFHSAFTSFPSGHTMAAFAFFTIFVFLFNHKLIELLLFFLAVLVAISRIYLGQHFLADVAAGAFLGSMIAFIVYFIMFKINKMPGNIDRSILGKVHSLKY
jgi:membrane-associated phospholipid phosphatase